MILMLSIKIQPMYVMGLEGVGADLGHASSVAGTKSSCFILLHVWGRETVYERIK